MCSLFLLVYGSEQSQEILKSLNKALEKHLEMCRKTGTVIVLKLDIDFVALWDNPMQDGSVKQTALTDGEKNCADSDDFG